MRIKITDDDMTIHVHTEEIPPVEVVTWVGDGQEGGFADTDLLAIGQREIDTIQGINLDAVDRTHYEHQLLEAIAAIRFFDKEQHE